MKSLLAGSLLFCSLIAHAAFGQVSFRPLGTLRSDLSSFVTAISPDGSTPVGFALAGNQDGTTSSRAIQWRQGLMRVLESRPPYWSAGADGASFDGSIVVGGGQIGNGGPGTMQRGFRADPSSVTYLTPLAGDDSSSAGGITPDGTIIVGSSGSHPCVWDAGLIPTALPAPADAVSPAAKGISADGSRILGTFSRRVEGRYQPGLLLWTDRQTPQEIPSPVAQPFVMNGALSLDGNVVVGYAVQQQPFQRIGFRWTESDGLTPLPDGLTPYACSADGSTIGGMSAGGTYGLAALLEGDQIIDVNELLVSLGIDLTGWELTDVKAVSADGMIIAGTGVHHWGPNAIDVRSEGWIAVIPGPCSGAAILLGATMTGVRRRRPLSGGPGPS
jgi:uncharacterized membrane protein